MAIFNETRAPTSRKYVAEQVILMPNWLKVFQTFLWQFSVFALEKQPEKLNFQTFLPLTEPLVATFNETRAPISTEYVSKQVIVLPNWLKTF